MEVGEEGGNKRKPQEIKVLDGGTRASVAVSIPGPGKREKKPNRKVEKTEMSDEGGP